MQKIENKEKNKTGRPQEWTEERLEDLSLKLQEWSQQPNSYALVQFCRDYKLHRTKLYYLASKSESFLDALMYAKTSIASRMIENINSKDGNCHPVFFNKYIRVNDFLLDEFLKEQEKTQINEMNKREVKIVDFSKYKKELPCEEG